MRRFARVSGSMVQSSGFGVRVLGLVCRMGLRVSLRCSFFTGFKGRMLSIDPAFTN